MKRYETYKDSGVQWIGEIPSHWNAIRIKYIFKEVDEKNTNLEYALLSFSRTKGIIPFNELNEKEPSAADLSKYKIIRPNQLLENRMQAWSGMFGCAKIYGCVSPDYSVFEALNNNNTDYFANLFRTPLLVQQFANASKGVGDGFNRLYTPQFGNIYAIVPPIHEQETIVAFLNEKTAEIDELVCEVEREIELLKEYKQAEIARVVTKGLNPNAPMKPSGISWIGDIPKHWEILRNKNLFESHYEPVGDRKNIPLLSLTTDGVILRDVESGKGKFPKDFEKYNVVYPEQIIFCLFDIDETPRTVGLNNNYGMITNAYDTFNINKSNVLPIFITNYYLAVDNVKALRPYYTGLRKVVQYGKFMQLKVPVPPIAEQQEIVDYINHKTTEIDRLVVELTYQVEYLKEYKQRLIADVVTGKVNVQPE